MINFYRKTIIIHQLGGCQVPRIFALLLVLTLMSGCSSLHVMSHVPLATMSRLSALKLTDIEPAQLRVAARMPKHIEPRKDGVKVTIALGQTKTELLLEPAVEAHELAALSRFERAGTRLWSYRLSVTDSARLQQMIAAAASSGQRQVSIAAGVDACRRGSLGSGPLPTTTYLRTDATGFIVLAEDLDLRSVVPERDLASKVPPCN